MGAFAAAFLMLVSPNYSAPTIWRAPTCGCPCGRRGYHSGRAASNLAAPRAQCGRLDLLKSQLESGRSATGTSPPASLIPLLFQQPHRRYNALSGDWVLVSPHRAQRPWQGRQETVPSAALAGYASDCYLCPGNQRANGAHNPAYSGVHVFQNDFPALLAADSGAAHAPAAGLLRAQLVRGECRVICYSAQHNQALATMPLPAIGAVVDVWAQQSAELGARYAWVQIFENKGELMGCSNPHPHGQIWCMDALPNEAAKEDRQQRDYFSVHGKLLLADYAQQEEAQAERMLLGNDHWLALVPFWALWPYELLLLPRRPVARLPDLSAPERTALAALLQQVLVRYDNLFETAFPYSLGWHGAPFGADAAHWQLHAHLYPPLLRSATVKKFMVGFELLAEAQRDLTAEQAAAQLRSLPAQHYSLRSA